MVLLLLGNETTKDVQRIGLPFHWPFSCIEYWWPGTLHSRTGRIKRKYVCIVPLFFFFLFFFFCLIRITFVFICRIWWCRWSGRGWPQIRNRAILLDEQLEEIILMLICIHRSVERKNRYQFRLYSIIIKNGAMKIKTPLIWLIENPPSPPTKC